MRPIHYLVNPRPSPLFSIHPLTEAWEATAELPAATTTTATTNTTTTTTSTSTTGSTSTVDHSQSPPPAPHTNQQHLPPSLGFIWPRLVWADEHTRVSTARQHATLLLAVLFFLSFFFSCAHTDSKTSGEIPHGSVSL